MSPFIPGDGARIAPVLTTSQWLSLAHPVRMELVKIFGMSRSSGAHIQDGKVLSDGYTNKDLTRINTITMQVYLDSDEEDFFKLFNQILEQVEEKLTERKDTTPVPAKPIEVKITLNPNGDSKAEIISDNPDQDGTKKNRKPRKAKKGGQGEDGEAEGGDGEEA